MPLEVGREPVVRPLFTGSRSARHVPHRGIHRRRKASASWLLDPAELGDVDDAWPA
jgi:hypothetical protein